VTRAEKAQISGKQCTVQFSGKNATNLKTHLSRFHNEEFQLVETQDAEKEEASGNESSCKRVTLDTQPELATLMSCFSRTETNRVYAENSAEYNSCLHGSIADYTLLDQGVFRSVNRTLRGADAHPGLYIIEGWKFIVEGCK
jgi:hypothetical protein